MEGFEHYPDFAGLDKIETARVFASLMELAQAANYEPIHEDGIEYLVGFQVPEDWVWGDEDSLISGGYIVRRNGVPGIEVNIEYEDFIESLELEDLLAVVHHNPRGDEAKQLDRLVRNYTQLEIMVPGQRRAAQLVTAYNKLFDRVEELQCIALAQDFIFSEDFQETNETCHEVEFAEDNLVTTVRLSTPDGRMAFIQQDYGPADSRYIFVGFEERQVTGVKYTTEYGPALTFSPNGFGYVDAQFLEALGVSEHVALQYIADQLRHAQLRSVQIPQPKGEPEQRRDIDITDTDPNETI